MSQKAIREIKKNKWADKSAADLQAELRKQKSHGFDLRLDKASGKLENFREVLLTRRRIARLQTLLRQQELASSAKEAK